MYALVLIFPLLISVYCDYCDVFLTHDSSSVRKAHNLGRVHQQNVRDYYASVASELAEIEQLERQHPKAIAETRGLRMPPPMTEPTLSNGGREKYGIVPTPWMPLPIPYGMPARPVSSQPSTLGSGLMSRAFQIHITFRAISNHKRRLVSTHLTRLHSLRPT